MLRSLFCVLSDFNEKQLYQVNECPYDSGGYFIINGSEKVLIAQERMAANHVYVFAKAQPSPISFLSEIRSAVEKGGKTISTMQVKMFHRNQEKTVRVVFLYLKFRFTQKLLLARECYPRHFALHPKRHPYLGRVPWSWNYI